MAMVLLSLRNDDADNDYAMMMMMTTMILAIVCEDFNPDDDCGGDTNGDGDGDRKR